jgi:hypothetical protein
MIKINLKKISIAILIILIVIIGVIFIIRPCPDDPSFGMLPIVPIKTETGKIIGGPNLQEKLLLWYSRKFCR